MDNDKPSEDYYAGDCGASQGSRRMWGTVFLASGLTICVLAAYSVWRAWTVLSLWMK